MTAGGDQTNYLIDPLTGQMLAATTGSDTLRGVYGPAGLVSQQQADGSWVFPIADRLGSVRGMLDADRETLEGRWYSPYGDLFDGEAGLSLFGFGGALTDPNGLVYPGVGIYYNPGIGQTIKVRPHHPGWEWLDQHQIAMSVTTGAAVGLAAVGLLATGAFSVPILAGVAIASLAAGGTVGATSVALNVTHSRPLGQNVLRNAGIAGGLAGGIPTVAYAPATYAAAYELSLQASFGVGAAGKLLYGYLAYDTIDDLLTYGAAFWGNPAAQEQLLIMSQLGPLDGPNFAMAMLGGGTPLGFKRWYRGARTWLDDAFSFRTFSLEDYGPWGLVDEYVTYRPAHFGYIDIIGFRGTGGIVSGRFSSERPLVRAGHVGISFNEGRRIYGFSPSDEAVEYVSRYFPVRGTVDERVFRYLVNADPYTPVPSKRGGGALWGQVRDDTADFVRASELASRGVYEGRTTVYRLRQRVTPEQFDTIQAIVLAQVENPALTRGQWYRLPEDRGVRMPIECNNCATWPRTLGLPLVEISGYLSDYMMALKASGAVVWEPQ